MADSDNSTSPSAVTRRRLLAGTMIAALPLPVAGGSTLEPASREIVLTLWRAWNEAHAVTDGLCLRQQRLEDRLMRTVGFLRVRSASLARNKLSWPPQVDDDPACADFRAKKKAGLATQQAHWEEADSKLGYSAAKRADGKAAGHEDRPANAL
jgi:hypothetical protein